MKDALGILQDKLARLKIEYEERKNRPRISYLNARDARYAERLDRLRDEEFAAREIAIAAEFQAIGHVPSYPPGFLESRVGTRAKGG